MLSELSIITKINILLTLVLIILAFLTINWHQENRVLYTKSIKVQTQKDLLIATNKYLKTMYSEQINGFETKEKAIDVLKMKIPSLKQSKQISL
jgi:cell division protein FtsL